MNEKHSYCISGVVLGEDSLRIASCHNGER